MTDLNKKLFDALVSQGLDPIIAESLARQTTKVKKQGAKRGFTPRVKIQVEINAILTCVTCGNKTMAKRYVEVYEDTNAKDQQSVVGICMNCVKTFYDLPKEQLISLIVIQNHADLELRKLGTKQQLKLAKRYNPQELLLKTYDKGDLL